MNESERRFMEMIAAGRKTDPWFMQTPERQRDLAQMQAIWSDLDQMPDLRRYGVVSGRTGRRRFLLMGAGGAVAAGIGAVTLVPRPDIRTRTGETQAASLADGTRVFLDASSSMDAATGDGLRDVRLIAGRARFDVTRGPEPFMIHTDMGNVRLEAGSATLHMWDDDMQVSCHNGTAELIRNDGRVVILGAGTRANTATDASIIPVPVIPDEDQWMHGRLVFDDRPLRHVITDLNRFRSGHIFMVGRGIGNLRMTGLFDANDPEAALQAITSAMPVRRRDVGPMVWLLDA